MMSNIKKGTRIQLVAPGSGRRESFAVEEAQSILNNPKNGGTWALPEHSKYQHVDGKIITSEGAGTPPQS